MEKYTFIAERYEVKSQIPPFQASPPKKYLNNGLELPNICQRHKITNSKSAAKPQTALI